MQTQDLKRRNSSGPGHGNYVCSKCGWSFPNPHPSPKHRKKHKKICGKIEGFKLGTTSEENKSNLDEHLPENDSKSPTNGLEVVKKVEEMAFTRSSSTGVEDVFSDAVTEFAVVPPAAGSNGVRETAVVMQDSSEAVGITQQDVGDVVGDAGDLYPPHDGSATQNQNDEQSRTENERSEIDEPDQHNLSSSTLESISSSDSSVIEASVSENTLQCSKTEIVLDSEEKGNLEAALDKKSEDIANVSSENAGKATEAVLLPQKVNGDEMECGNTNDSSSKIILSGKTNSSEKGTTEVEKSEDTMKIPAAFAGETSEAVSEPQMVNKGKLEIFRANAAVIEVNESQVEGFFDARNISFAKDDFLGQINSMEEASNVEADRSLRIMEGHGSISVPDALPLNEHSEDMLEDYEDQKTEKLSVAVSLELAQEVDCVEHGKDDANKDALSSLFLDESSKRSNKKTEDIISEARDQEDYSAEEVSVEQKMDTPATDANMCGSTSAVVYSDKDDIEIGESEMVTSPEQQNSVISDDKNVQSDLDETGNLTRTVNDFKPAHNDSEHDKKDTQIFHVLEADGSKVEEERLPVAIGSAVDYDDIARKDVENLSEYTPIAAQSYDGRDDKAEVRGDDEYGFKTAMSESSKASMEKFQDSETGVKDLNSSSKQVVSEGCVNLLDTDVITGIDNNAKITEETHFEENYLASDNVSLFNTAMNNDSQQVANEFLEDDKERENFGEKVSGKECLDQVDMGLISDNNDNLDLTQITSNKIEAEVQAEAVAGSAVEDSYTKKKDGGASDFAGDNGNHVKQEEAAPYLDVQVDSISQTDSLEGNWGSVSVLSSLSDAPAGTETGSQPSQSSTKVEKDSLQPKPNSEKSDTFTPPDFTKSSEQKVDLSGINEGVPEAQTPEKAPSGSKKAEEIIAKVANWSTDSGNQQHNSLKNFLGDSSSPNSRDNLPLKSQETEKKIIMDNNTKEPEPEPEPEPAMGEMQKEWNSSPGRYPTNIKREKGKGRSKPYWAPFICCSSVQTS